MSSPDGPAPTSASSSVSSSSSQSSSVRWSLDRTASSRAPSGEPDRASRPRSRASRPATGAGTSSSGATSASSGRTSSGRRSPGRSAPRPRSRRSGAGAGLGTSTSGGRRLVGGRGAASADEHGRQRDDDGRRDAGGQEDLEASRWSPGQSVGRRAAEASRRVSRTSRVRLSRPQRPWFPGSDADGLVARPLQAWRRGRRPAGTPRPRRPSRAGTGPATCRRAPRRRPPRRRAGRRRGSCGPPSRRGTPGAGTRPCPGSSSDTLAASRTPAATRRARTIATRMAMHPVSAPNLDARVPHAQGTANRTQSPHAGRRARTAARLRRAGQVRRRRPRASAG